VVEDIKQISFRVSADEYGHLERIARILAENGKIRNDGVGTLAKAFVFLKRLKHLV
jgi:hypothetical protein